MYPNPQTGASLVLSFPLQNRTVLVVGSGILAAQRAFTALEAGARVVVVAQHELCDELKWRTDQSQIELVDWDGSPETLAAFLRKESVWMAFVTTTSADKTALYEVFKSHHVLTNITDNPNLCDFSFTSTHRFSDYDTQKSLLQIGVTTNGHGCRLAARIRREIVARLPTQVGEAVRKVGMIRKIVLDKSTAATEKAEEVVDCDSDDSPDPNLNRRPLDSEPTRTRQLRWLAQISEYWPFEKLASLEEGSMNDLLGSAALSTPPLSSPPLHAASSAITIPAPVSFPSQHFTTLLPPFKRKEGQIFLVGSGPGHPSLLTLAAFHLLTTPSSIDLILSDKLVPPSILSLIPSTVPLQIARKFPGNADASQREMMLLAVEAARQGKSVVRLKQGDPGVYARLAEEYVFFEREGFRPMVVPGLSSALTGPLVAHPRPVALTSRGMAEGFVVCTGVGKGGKDGKIPEYQRERSVVVLMGVGRLREVIGEMVTPPSPSSELKKAGRPYPSNTPVSIIERASMPDQRVISSTLKDIVEALEWTGEQRPPGMMVVGWCNLGVGWDGVGASQTEKGAATERTPEAAALPELDDLLAPSSESLDEERIKKWLGMDEQGNRKRWSISEGMDPRWDELMSLVGQTGQSTR